jgi:hypothetical protein
MSLPNPCIHPSFCNHGLSKTDMLSKTADQSSEYDWNEPQNKRPPTPLQDHLLLSCPFRSAQKTPAMAQCLTDQHPPPWCRQQHHEVVPHLDPVHCIPLSMAEPIGPNMKHDSKRAIHRQSLSAFADPYHASNAQWYNLTRRTNQPYTRTAMHSHKEWITTCSQSEALTYHSRIQGVIM